MAKAKPKAGAAKAPARLPAPALKLVPKPAPPSASAPAPAAPSSPAPAPPTVASAGGDLPHGWHIATADGVHWRAFRGGVPLGATEQDRIGQQFDSEEKAAEAARRAAQG